MLKPINFSSSCACGANCIFYSNNHAEMFNLKIASFKNKEKIIDEVVSDEFKAIHDIKRF